MIEKLKLSLFVGSVGGAATDVAVIMGEASAPLGVAVGGAYVAVNVGAAGATKVPQAVGVEQLWPLAFDRVQETPELLGSFETVAFNTTGGPPAACFVNLFVMVTAIPGTMVKLKLSIEEFSLTEVAVIVGEAFAPVGSVAGGVYVALKVGPAGGTKVPQSAGQGAPAEVVRVQETPALGGSLVTVAVNTTDGPPAVCVVNLFVMLTLTAGRIEKSNVKILLLLSTAVAVMVAV